MKTKNPVIRIPADCATTRLERNALRWLNESADYQDGATGRYRDLMHGGCQAGLVEGLGLCCAAEGENRSGDQGWGDFHGSTSF